LTRTGLDYNIDESIAMMKHTNEVEKYLGTGTGFIDCFKGPNLRRTEIACLVWVAQTFGGGTLTGYAPYFYLQAGFSATQAFDLGVGMYGLAIVGQLLSWGSMRVFGRRTLYLVGLAISCVTLIVGGSIGTRPDNPSTSWALGSLIIFLTFVYDSTIGPVCYTLVAEVPSTRLRIKTVVLARVAYNLAGIIANILQPRMLNPTAWNWKGKTCFMWAGTCLVMLAWCYFRLPEPKGTFHKSRCSFHDMQSSPYITGLTYMELDILFEKKARTRAFRRLQVTLAESGYFSIDETSSSSGLRGWF
jgi:MFS transporter, SP family, general alpha glucoside:H+ symporter